MPSAEPRFLGDNLTLIREFHQQTRAQLAKGAFVAAPFVGAIERNLRQPSRLLVAALSEVSGVLPEFFYAPIEDRLEEGRCIFRQTRSVPVGARRYALAHGTLFAHLVRYLDAKLKLPKASVPAINATTQVDIERAAESCRMRWGLGIDTPIVSVARVLEHAGVAVAVADAGERLDGFACPRPTRDVVFLNSSAACGSRARHDAARQLGHLVLRRAGAAVDQDTDLQADAFASAFLLPRAGISREFPRSPLIEWETVFKLKHRWRVSVLTLVRRAFDLGLISAVAYRRAYKYINWQGWHRQEPVDFTPERPELIPLALQKLEDRGTSGARVARDLLWSVETLELVAQTPVKHEQAEAAGVVVALRGRR